ncbi:MAG: replicative DNA helicase [Candidatus Shikimatogenerans sp. AspAUS03]|uniref:Replicative DNA helicase n=1 Tax=Candidatus Shikimatogenerans sp. AspAUS03 TaxID=3158563 RepID=A0AAU7QS97_9FLAO
MNKFIIKKFPHNLKIEKTVIGIILMDSKSFIKVIDLLSTNLFYDIKNKILYKYIKKNYIKYKKIDIITIINQLTIKNKINFLGGEKYLMSLVTEIIDYSNIRNYVKILKKYYLLRNLIKLSYSIIEKSFKGNINILEHLYKIEKRVFNLFDSNKSFITLNKSLNLIKKNIKKKPKKNTGLLSGFKELDKITTGWQKTDLIIIAARPGMGKTSFALSMILKIIKKKKSICFFSLEMSSKHLVNKLLTYESNINFYKIKNLDLKKKEKNLIYKKIKKLKKYKLYIDDSSSLSILDLKFKCRKYIFKYNIKLIVIDYLQLLSGYKKNKYINKEQEISIISKNLKAMAKEFNIPIIVISQLSRAVEIREGNKKPILSDLRDSGAIEQDADIVIFLYRENYYYKYNTNKKYEKTELIISKHRNGILKTIKIKFLKKNAKFIN